MQFVEAHRLESLEAFLAVVYLFVGEQPLLRRLKNHGLRLLHLHRDLLTQWLRNCPLSVSYKQLTLPPTPYLYNTGVARY